MIVLHVYLIALPLLSKEQLLELWRVAFPMSQLRPTASVVGKCRTCAAIDRGRSVTSDNRVRQALSHVHALHRGAFMSERLQYKKRIAHAGQKPNRRLSLIIDGMVSNFYL